MREFIVILRLIIYVTIMLTLMWATTRTLFHDLFNARNKQANQTYQRHYFKFMGLSSLFLIFSQVLIWRLDVMVPLNDNPYRFNVKYVMFTACGLLGLFFLVTVKAVLFANVKPLKIYGFIVIMWIDILFVYGLLFLIAVSGHLIWTTGDTLSSLGYSLLVILTVFWLVSVSERELTKLLER